MLRGASGSPVAIDVNIERIPAKADADNATRQSTSANMNEVPMVAINVWQKVLSALIKAHLMNCFMGPPYTRNAMTLA